MEGLYHVSIAGSVTKADSTVRTGAPQGQEGLSVSAPAPYLAPMLQRTFPAGFIAPCLPTKTDKLPSGDLWLHEIKHDGFRVIARKDGDRVRLYMKREEEEDWRRRRT
jgi:ATP-dependent DNA ligase